MEERSHLGRKTQMADGNNASYATLAWAVREFTESSVSVNT